MLGGTLQMAQIPQITASQMNTEKENKNMLGDVLGGKDDKSDLISTAMKFLPMILG